MFESGPNMLQLSLVYTITVFFVVVRANGKSKVYVDDLAKPDTKAFHCATPAQICWTFRAAATKTASTTKC